MDSPTTMSVEWGLVEREIIVVHKGFTILVDDFSHLHGSELARIVYLHRDSAMKRNRYGVLNLIDATGATADREVLAALKATATDTAKFYKKAAVIGVTGVSKFFLQLVNTVSNMGIEPFDSRQEALDWLVED